MGHLATVRFGTGSVPVEKVEVSAYTVPTDSPESDGTLEWNKTTVVVVEAAAGGARGLGYTYADVATGLLVKSLLAGIVKGRDALDVPASWTAMARAVRNLGRPGVSSMAISAVDAALWDLKAKLLNVSLAKLLGMAREGVAVYGSGGFTSYSIDQLQAQLAGWAADGIPRVKMKIGRQPDQDCGRVRAARDAIGDKTELFVDANGAYGRKQALSLANEFKELDVRWFEEPVTSDDLEGLRLVREHCPVMMEIAAGEYGYELTYFSRMVEAGAVDVLQADATRCAGVTGFLKVGAIAEARKIPLSAHTAPSLHLPLCCALPSLRNLEYFHDHVRIEKMLFEGAVAPVRGVLYPDLSRPGLGLELRRQDAERFAVN
ncbi:MAG: enolase C-terminal domain-like protein [Terriglobia bacterium]